MTTLFDMVDCLHEYGSCRVSVDFGRLAPSETEIGHPLRSRTHKGLTGLLFSESVILGKLFDTQGGEVPAILKHGRTRPNNQRMIGPEMTARDRFLAAMPEGACHCARPGNPAPTKQGLWRQLLMLGVRCDGELHNTGGDGPFPQTWGEGSVSARWKPCSGECSQLRVSVTRTARKG